MSYADEKRGFGVGGFASTPRKKVQLQEWRCPNCQVTVERWRAQCDGCGQARTNSYGTP